MQYFADHRGDDRLRPARDDARPCRARRRAAAFDRVLATRLGAAAVDQLATRHPACDGTDQNEITATPLADIAGKTKPIDPALLELARVLAQ